VRALSIIAFAVASAATTAQAAGFFIPEQSAAAAGRGTAVAADLNDPSTIFYNPANVAELQGMQASVGANGVLPKARFTQAGTGQRFDSENRFFVSPNAYFTYHMTELLSFGLGIAGSPFGLGVAWAADTPARSIVRREDLRTVFISPVAALRLSPLVPGLSVAAGVDVVPASVYLRQDVLFGTSSGQAQFGASAIGAGGRFGLAYRPPVLDGLSLGVAYKTRVNLAFDGSADFDAPPEFRAALPPDSHVTTELTLPDQLLFGAAYRYAPFLLEVDTNWVGWRSFKTLQINLPHGTTIVQRKDWRDAWVLRVGAEYAWRELTVRAGYIRDPTPVPGQTLDFVLPDYNRNDLTFGLGYALRNDLRVDGFVLWVLPGDNVTSSIPNQPPFKGTYRVSALLFGLNVTYQGLNLGP
jgi:long-chain fatty acid transport protein